MIKYPPSLQKNTPKALQKCSTKNKQFPAVIIKLQKYLLILIIAVFAEYLPAAAFVNIALR